MVDAFRQLVESCGNAFFISVLPQRQFLSSGGQPLVTSMIPEAYQSKVFTQSVDSLFEFGTVGYRASVYQRLILKHIPRGVPIISSDDEACWMAAAACADRNPFVAVLHGDEQAYFDLVNKYKSSICACICVSNRILKKVTFVHPELKNFSVVIPCGIFTEEFENVVEKKNDLVWIGRVNKYQKRAFDIIPIFKLVLAKYSHLKLTVLGTGDFYDTLVQLVDIYRLENNVHLQGWVNSKEVKSCLAESKIFLQTSDFEGASVAMMEALASGCIVVSTRVSGVEDLENLPDAMGVVYLYKVGDVQEAAAILLQILQQDIPGRNERARILAKTYFDIGTNNARLMHFVAESLEKGKVKHVERFNIGFLSLIFSYILVTLRKCKLKLASKIKH